VELQSNKFSVKNDIEKFSMKRNIQILGYEALSPYLEPSVCSASGKGAKLINPMTETIILFNTKPEARNTNIF
jgi:hypothetical protein